MFVIGADALFVLSAQCFSVIFGILLPSVSTSLYFYSGNDDNENANAKQNGNVNGNISSDRTNGSHVTRMSTSAESELNGVEKSNGSEMPRFSLLHAIQRIVNHIRTSYSNATVVQWSILWAMSMCGFLQVRAAIVNNH